MRKRPPSYADVAERAGVSRTTVSFVLQGRDDVSITQATRDKVLEAVQELGYKRNRLAGSLMSGKSTTIGVIVPRLDHTFFGDIVQGVSDVCEEHNYRVLLAHTAHSAEQEAKQVNLLEEHRADGLVCVTDEQTIGKIDKWLAAAAERMPIVLIDDRSKVHKVDSVISDDLQGVGLLVDHLASLGHRRIGHLAGGSLTSSARDRMAGYRRGLERAGVEFDPELVRGSSFEIDDTGQALRELLATDDPPTAIIAANDIKAGRAMKHLRQLGLRVPEDVAVVGYADEEMSDYLDLTTVHQDGRMMGRLAAERLMGRSQRIEGPILQVVSTRLVVRASSGGTITGAEIAEKQKRIAKALAQSR